MKSILRNAAAIGTAMVLLASPLAMAQQSPGGYGGQQQGNNHMQGGQMGGMGQPNGGHMQGGPQGNDGHMQGGPQGNNDHMQGGMGQDGHRDNDWNNGWRRGDHFNGNRDVVQDWQGHHLHRPPSGYEWVQDGNQFVLIAITSGIIASIIAGSLSH